MLQISLVRTPDVDAVWPRLATGFQAACEAHDGCQWTAGGLWQLVRSGHGFLILVHDGTDVFAASIWRFEGERPNCEFRCHALYGRHMRQWLTAKRDFVEQMARENGASKLTAAGRAGWARLYGRKNANGDYEVTL